MGLRQPSSDGLLLLGHIDHPAAPLADLLEQLVMADLAAGLFHQRDGRGDSQAWQRWGGFGQELARALVGQQQRLDPLAQ